MPPSTTPAAPSERTPDDVREELLQRSVFHLLSASAATISGAHEPDETKATLWFAQADYWRVRAEALDLVREGWRTLPRPGCVPAEAD